MQKSVPVLNQQQEAISHRQNILSNNKLEVSISAMVQTLVAGRQGGTRG